MRTSKRKPRGKNVARDQQKQGPWSNGIDGLSNLPMRNDRYARRTCLAVGSPFERSLLTRVSRVWGGPGETGVDMLSAPIQGVNVAGVLPMVLVRDPSIGMKMQI